ncbi:aldolase/citrate lyase family protein [Micromonospora sp. NPDC005206]|uniref:HpcH/HpaI aldolase family protein n=1 Tax=Micromonospora sp. NPDC005206 TaxID=3157022 RepID=UPI00339EE47B
MSVARNLRRALVDGDRQILGTFVIVPRVEVVEAAAAGGFDLVVLDCEHGPFGVEALPPLIAAAHGAGIAAVVRVARNDEPNIGAALDAGADGVLVPHVSSRQEAEDVVRASRFQPHGERSVHLWVRASGYGLEESYVTTADDRTAVIAMIEGIEARERLPEILPTAGIDAFFVGPMDLAASLGLAHTPYAPEVIEAARDIVQRSAEAGKATAIFAPTPEHAALWLSAGVKLVVLSVDTQLIRTSFTAAVAAATCPAPDPNPVATP